MNSLKVFVIKRQTLKDILLLLFTIWLTITKAAQISRYYINVKASLRCCAFSIISFSRSNQFQLKKRCNKKPFNLVQQKLNNFISCTPCIALVVDLIFISNLTFWTALKIFKTFSTRSCYYSSVQYHLYCVSSLTLIRDCLV